MELKCAEDLKKLILETCYPIGHIWVSMNSTNPKDIVGGTWVQITDKFLYCRSTASKVTGGSTTTGSHTLTIDQIPSHNHNEYIDVNGGRMPYTLLGGGGTGTSSNGVFFGGTRNTYNGQNVGTSNTGGGNGHTHSQNLPPHMTCYAWYRTA